MFVENKTTEFKREYVEDNKTHMVLEGKKIYRAFLPVWLKETIP